MPESIVVYTPVWTPLAICLGPPDDAGSGRDADFDDPVAITPGTYGGCMATADSSDTYTVAVLAGDRIELTASPSDCDEGQMGRLLASVSIVSAANASLSEGYDADGGEVCASVRAATVAPFDGTARLRVVNWGGGAYEFTARVGALPALCDPQDDAGSGTDSGGAPPIHVDPGAYDGCLDRFDVHDRYFVSVEAGQLVYAVLEPAMCDVFLYGRYWDERTAGRNWETCARQELGAAVATGGSYPVSMWRGRAEGAYRVTIAVAESFPRFCAVQDDAASGGDSSGTTGHNFYVSDHAAATPLPDGTSAGCVDLFDGWDEYRLDVAPGEVARVTIRPTDCSALYLMHADVNWTTTSSRATPGPDGCYTWSWGFHGGGLAGFGTERQVGGDTGFVLTVERCGDREPVPWDRKYWSNLAMDACPPEEIAPLR